MQLGAWRGRFFIPFNAKSTIRSSTSADNP
jgi:hypothetical protein